MVVMHNYRQTQQDINILKYKFAIKSITIKIKKSMKKVIFTLTVAFATGIATLNAQVTNGLVAKWSFNNGNANDEVGTNHLTTQNGATYGTDRFGNLNKSASLDGTDDYLRTNSPFFSPGNPYSFSLWFKSNNSTQGLQTLFNTDPHTQLAVGYNWYGDGTFDIGISSGSGWDICSTAPNGLDTFNITGIDVTNWNHWVMTFDGTNWNTYANNILVNTCNSGTPSNTLSDLFFGAISVGPQSYFSGLIDDIRIYDRALNTTEIDSLFNEPNPITTGITDIYSNKNSITIYPNPTNNTINFSIQTNVQLTNATGQIIADRKNVITLDLSDQPKGIYFLILTDNNGQVTQRSKIVKE